MKGKKGQRNFNKQCKKKGFTKNFLSKEDSSSSKEESDSDKENDKGSVTHGKGQQEGNFGRRRR